MSKHTSYPEIRCHYLTVVQAASYLGVSKSFLDKARIRGDGPTFIRIGGAVRYAIEDLDAFASSRRVRSTSEAA
jgi:excisionase family DNA binding protein